MVEYNDTSSPVTITVLLILFLLIAMNVGYVHLTYTIAPISQYSQAPPSTHSCGERENGEFALILFETIGFLIFLFLLYWVGRKKGKEFMSENIIPMVIAGIIAIGVALFLVPALKRIPGGSAVPEGSGSVAGLTTGPVIFYLAIVVFMIIIGMVIRRNVRFLKKSSQKTKELKKYVDDAIYSAKIEGDVREAIIRAYRELEKMMRNYGVEDKRHYTPREFESFALNSLNLSEEPVHALVELFEIARYSHHEMSESERGVAIKSLEEIRNELQENGS